jgi:arylsulfatase A-like enzyme
MPKVPEDKPFAAFLSYGTPHGPFDDDNVPEDYRARFLDVDFPHPPNYKPENDPHADAWGRLTEEERTNLPNARRNHHAMTANLDWNIGRLLRAIDELGLGENTIVVLSSDHGDMMGAQGLRNKNIFYEEAARIPFLVRWPENARAGRVSDACLSTVDMMPTVLSLLGLPIPETVEGMDLSHCVRGEPGDEPEAAFLQNTGACAAWEDGHEWRALRDKQYTYALYRVDRSELLFDNANDPYQMHNLAGDSAYREVLNRFRRILATKMLSLNDHFQASSYYRDHWIRDRIILRGARG